MSALTALAVFAASYLAGGVLTILALAFMNRRGGRIAGRTQAAARTESTGVWLREFALWPCVVLMGVVFAIIMLMQKRQLRASPTVVERVVWATEMAVVLALGCLALPFYLVLNLGWLVLTVGGRLPQLGTSRDADEGA